MKKLVALSLLGMGLASQVTPSSYDDEGPPPCNIPTPSPKNSPQNSPRNNDSDNK